MTPKLAGCTEEAVGRVSEDLTLQSYSNGHIRPSFAFVLSDQSTAYRVKPDLKQFTLIQQERNCRLYDENMSIDPTVQSLRKRTRRCKVYAKSYIGTPPLLSAYVPLERRHEDRRSHVEVVSTKPTFQASLRALEIDYFFIMKKSCLKMPAKMTNPFDYAGHVSDPVLESGGARRREYPSDADVRPEYHVRPSPFLLGGAGRLLVV